ncbi:MAG: subtype II CRISPR-associated endonuclease Cas1 [Bacteroidetes bacterium]|nr:MAG: subtype II CRISPR-associated endonuclease Cas1 [Bacteroidota bacterium]PIE88311.1 MAG: subtype II CRISPR-associated endonuclease Cas1 [Bacteroidota bacterium]
MLKRTIYIGNPSYLKLKHKQLVIVNPETKDVRGTVPIEDMALLLLDHPQITLSSLLIDRLMSHGVGVVHCDTHHLPNGLLLPLVGHSELTQRWNVQLGASMPLKKQLWKQTVLAKIENQKRILQRYGGATAPMEQYMARTTSGDEENMEGKAANHYWKQLFENFQRHRFGHPPNNYFNFGYAILRSIVARALVSSGLLPAQGLFHKNKYNPYCLADDVMEPYRPFVDQLIMAYLEEHTPEMELSTQEKGYLLQIATQDVFIDHKVRPLMVAVSTTTASLYKCFTGERRTILYPLVIT